MSRGGDSPPPIQDRVKTHFNPKKPGGWLNVPQNFYLNLILLAIVDPDGDRTTFSCTAGA